MTSRRAFAEQLPLDRDLQNERDGLSSPRAKSNRSKSVLATIQPHKIREGARLAAWHAR
jgi:hypothetical protein